MERNADETNFRGGEFRPGARRDFHLRRELFFDRRIGDSIFDFWLLICSDGP